MLIDEASSNLEQLDNVINLSDRQLTTIEKNILNKGLNFCPTPGEPDMGEIRRDLDRYHRSLRIQCWLTKHGGPHPTQTSLDPYDDIQSLKIKSESNWTPPLGPPNLEHIIATNELGLLQKPFTRTKRTNTTPVERKCISDLAKDESIVIKKADKGGAIVIQNRKDYIAEGERQLKNGKFYTKLQEDPTTDHNTKIKTQLDAMLTRGEITKKVRNFLYLENPRTPQLYLLPKVHKNQNPPPGRPIISANQSPTERISAFVDTFIRPIVTTGKSYIKDTTDFINKLDDVGKTEDGSLLVSLDVNSLYTNIPNKDGAEATYEYLEKYRDSEAKPSNLSIAELLWLVLTLNNFQFNDTNYLQIGGTAMGTRLAPSFANLYMYHYEDKFVYPYHLQPKVWYRYIDDVFMIWDHGKDELDKFVTHLNMCNANITFSSEISPTHLSFLDVKVKLIENQLVTDLYTKPTDRNTYLPYNSAHPQHCMRGLPYGQFLRIRRICSNNEDFEKHSAVKAAQLLQHGYPKELLVEGMFKAYSKHRESLLTKPCLKKAQTVSEHIYLTTTYNKEFSGLREQVESTWDLLERSSTTRSLKEKTLKVGYRRPKSLKDLLIRAKLPQPRVEHTSETHKAHARCCNRNCRYCQRLNTKGYIQAHATGRKYSTRKKADCASNNLVYCITCKKCGKQYVGQTKNSLKERFQAHFYLIRHKKTDHEVARHFNTGSHRGIDDVQIHILTLINNDVKKEETKGIRLRTEFDWIHRLRTQIPLGLNTIDTDYM